MTTTTRTPAEPTTDSSSDSTTPEESTTEKSTTAPDQETATPSAEEKPQETSPENREAAKYRVRLREAESQRDQLDTKLRSLADHVLGDQLKRFGLNPAALQAAGHDTAQFFTDDGKYDPAAVETAAREAAERFGIPKPTGAGYVPASGTGGERATSGGWENIIKG